MTTLALCLDAEDTVLDTLTLEPWEAVPTAHLGPGERWYARGRTEGPEPACYEAELERWVDDMLPTD